MSERKENIKLSKWLDNDIPHSFSYRDELIEIIETIAEATIPIRGLLERGITSREIEQRMEIEKAEKQTINLYGEFQIHEDILTHSIILKALQESEVNFLICCDNSICCWVLLIFSIDAIDSSPHPNKK